MMTDKSVHKCPHCGRLYESYMHMVGDQSVCPKCRAAAKQNDYPEQTRRWSHDQ